MSYALPTFCGVCRHQTNLGTGHEPDCPVLTGEPVRGINGIPQDQVGAQLQQQQNGMMGSFSTQCPFCGGLNGMHYWACGTPCPGANPPVNPWPGQGRIPLEDGYEVAQIYKEARGRLLEELKAQVEVNRRLTQELLEVRLELAQLKKLGG